MNVNLIKKNKEKLAEQELKELLIKHNNFFCYF